MNIEGLSGLVNRVIAWADRLQREHGVPGFPYAVIKKYGDDAGGRHAALITYYGSFAPVASMFALLYLIGRALVHAAEVAAVRPWRPGCRTRPASAWPQAMQMAGLRTMSTDS